LRNFSQAGSFGPVPDAKQSSLGEAARYVGLGVELAATVVLGALAGQWADRKTGASGVFTIVGALLGFGVTMYSLIRGLRGSDKNRK
jgi:F0F1-type ATP synthase assembly protein I